MSEEQKSNFGKYIIFVIAAILIIGAFVYLTRDEDVDIISNSTVNIQIGTSPVKGLESAPVTIIEFSDYECPFCGRNYRQNYPLLVQNYIETGKVKYSFKDYPLPEIHPQAQKAAEAARAIRAQLGDEGYWLMHNKLYENQDALSVENYKKWAREISGIDGQKFDNDLDSGKYASEVEKDFNEGRKIGVKGTPAFFVNGHPIIGACPYNTFKEAVDAELEGKIWSVDNQCKISIQ